MSADIFPALVAKAILAPSVHNVQPARWRIEGDAIVLVEDMSRRLLVGDPNGNDIGISLGAALEGLGLAASELGFAVVADNTAPLPDLPEPWRAVARFRLQASTQTDPLAAFVVPRASWRGEFPACDETDRERLRSLTGDDTTPITSPAALHTIASQYDKASFSFMRQTPFRRELTGWMRLNKSHPSWSRDGLNADAMVLSPLEAAAASFVLGPAFPVLDAVKLAPILLAEGQKIKQAAGIILFHREKGEAPFDSGRAFYRLWLRLEAAGFGGGVLAALADDLPTAKALCAAHAIGPDSRLVSAFRVGRHGPKKPSARARLDVREVLV